MKKTKLSFYPVIIFLIMFCASNIFAQPTTKKLDVKWSPIVKAKKADLDDVIGVDDKAIYTILSQRKGMMGLKYDYYIEKYDHQMKPIKSEKVDLNHKGEDLNFAFSTMATNDDIYLFSTYLNTKTKVKYLFSQTLNKQTLKGNNNIKKVAEIDFSDFSKYNPGNFSVTYSPDSSKIMIYYNTPYDKKANEKFGFVIYDAEMNELWASLKTLPIPDNLFIVEEYRVDNNGDVYVLGLVFNEQPKAKVKGEPNYNYRLIKYEFNTENEEEYPILVEGKFLTDLQFTINKEGDIICAGFYSNEKVYNISGAFYMKIDEETKNVLVSDFIDIDASLLTQNLNEKQSNKVEKREDKGKKVNLLQYNLDNLVVKDDGGITLVGENYYVIVRQVYNAQSKSWRNVYHYYYNQILVVDISDDGKIQWVKQVPKNQHTIDDYGYYSSYGMVERDGSIYFLYNDNPKNLYFKPGDKLFSFKRKSGETLTMFVEVDKEGAIKREVAFNQKTAEVIMRPKSYFQINDNEFILFGKERKVYRLAKVSFK